MDSNLIQIITAVSGTVGFAIYFNVDKPKLIPISFGAFISWVMYLFVLNMSNSLFLANFLSAILVCIYSEIMARVLKTPANICLIPSVVPLLPGSSFYYTMLAAISMNMNVFRQKGMETFMIILGISLGIVVGFFIFVQSLKVFHKIKSHNLS